MVSELSRPKLIFRIADCFKPEMYAQFAQEYKNFKTWHFEAVMNFIDERMSNLQFKDRHLYDLSTIIGEEKIRGHKVSVKNNKRTSSINSFKFTSLKPPVRQQRE